MLGLSEHTNEHDRNRADTFAGYLNQFNAEVKFPLQNSLIHACMFLGNNGLVYCRVRRLSSADPAKEAIFRTFWKAPSKNSISTRSSSEEHGMSVCSCMHACSSRESLARMRIYLDSYTSISCSISNAGRPILICCG